MDKEARINDICEQSLSMLGGALSETIAYAIIEGYKLGLEECANEVMRLRAKLRDFGCEL